MYRPYYCMGVMQICIALEVYQIKSSYLRLHRACNLSGKIPGQTLPILEIDARPVLKPVQRLWPFSGMLPHRKRCSRSFYACSQLVLTSRPIYKDSLSHDLSAYKPCETIIAIALFLPHLGSKLVSSKQGALLTRSGFLWLFSKRSKLSRTMQAKPNKGKEND